MALGICAILLTQAVPSLQHFIQRNRLSAAVNRFSASLQYARSEAVRRGRRVVLCPSVDLHSCAASEQWGQGWIVFADSDGDRERSRGEPLLRTAQGLPDDISMRS
ncbi:MAG: GspH/FimT family pseudopilin, partial [Gammaproteobacteria bacterium]